MRFLKNILTAFVLMLVITGASYPGLVSGQTPLASPDSDATPAANDVPQFVLRPSDGADGSFFTVNAAPGSTTELTAVIGNAGTETIDLRTFSSDAVVLVNGGFGVKEEEAETTGATNWLDWHAETVTFQPGEGIERSFSVTIPENTAPGEYIAGISLETAEPIEIPGSTMFNQIIRKSIAVFVIVEGETSAAFELGDPEIITTQSGSRLEISVSNTGDLLVKPTGTLSLIDVDGNEVFSADIVMGSVYARMETILAIPLDPSLAGQEYEVRIDLNDEATEGKAKLESGKVEFSGEIPEEAAIQITEAAVLPMPEDEAPVYAAVDATISNSEAPLANANVVLHVYRDGEPMEQFLLASNTTIAAGDTEISQRYIPAEGFDDGEWTFSITIETVGPQSNATTVVIDHPIEDAILIP